MSERFRECERDQQVLATDLDGTFVPLSGNSRNRADLKTIAEKLRQHEITLTFVTGRHLESVQRAIVEHALPKPDWIICDVGTTIYENVGIDDLREVVSYRSHLESIIASCPIAQLRELLSGIAGLRLQEPEKQGQFKLSYYTEQSQVDSVAQTIQERLARADAPFSLIHSVDPFTGEGLIDLLPKQVSKAHALEWWVNHTDVPKESVVYAGDSGNDLAAFLAGYRTILVGNTDRDIADRVYDHHRNNQWHGRLFLSKEHGTSGVLEGCYWFDMLSAD
jgi:HAD superfamily hydrolase (TIGR01484 family)